MTVEISTAEQFIALKDRTDRGTADAPLDIVFTNDLDFSEINDFEGLGNAVLYANINGNGYAIKNLVANCSGNMYIMGYISNGTIRNIVFDNCHISASGILYVFYTAYCNYDNIVIKNNNVFATNSNIYIIYALKCNGYTVNKVAVGGTYNCREFNLFSLNEKALKKINNCYLVANVACSYAFYGFGNLTNCDCVYNCFVRCNVTTTANASYYCGFATNTTYSGHTSNYMFCYAANKLTGSFSNHYNFITPKSYANVVSCFYDSTLDTTTKNCEGTPATMTQLKSAEWLRSQGWAI